MLRRTDTDQDYDYADAGERTDYYLTDQQFSVVAVVADDGALQERVAYSAYGEARHHYPADMNGDGDVDPGDSSWFSNINNLKDIDEAGYNPDGDLNRDGSVDSGDVSIASGWNGSAALAKGLISDPDGPGSPIGYDGYVFNAETKLYTVRARHYEPVTGRWMERDPAGAVNGMSRLQYAASDPIAYIDWSGLAVAGSDPDDEEWDSWDEKLFRILDDRGYFAGSSIALLGHVTSLACDMQDFAEYSLCVLNCLAENPEKIADALKAAGFAVGKDILEDMNFWIALPFMLVNVDPSTGEAEWDQSGMSAAAWEIVFAAIEKDAVGTGNKACILQSRGADMMEIWAKSAGFTPADEAAYLEMIRKGRKLGRRSFRQGFLASGLRSIGKGASKANAAVTAAYETAVALRAALEEAGESCEAECGECPSFGGSK